MQKFGRYSKFSNLKPHCVSYQIIEPKNSKLMVLIKYFLYEPNQSVSTYFI